ncbi:MAG TPA: PLP-dependent aminotransferase family protein [Dysgonamonadaceae bacterium]|nr:PLP-dependent aminotransferase family protein [Dysgonamonadaceae bacterium]
MPAFSNSVKNLRSSEIRDLMSLANKPEMILFSGGMPDNDLFPLDEIDAIYNKLTPQEKKIAMQYGPTSGLPQLIESLSLFLESKGLPVSENKIMITTGSLQAINILAKAFINPGDTIIVENPCFIGAISAFNSYEANIVSVPLSEDGIALDQLEKLLKDLKQKPKFIYLTPNFHNPAGTLYTAETKQKLIQLLDGAGIPIIEDDVYSDLYFDEADKESLKSIKGINPKGIDVCYTGSFSKIIGPGLRLGWMLVPNEIYEKCELIKQTFDACSPSFTQVIADKFLQSGIADNYIEKVRVEYKKRSKAMINALHQYLPQGVTFTAPRGGFYIWLQLPEGVDSTEILKKAIEKGVVFVSGKTFDPHAQANNYMRLSYCNTSVDKINKGIPLVASAIKEVLAAH